MKSRDLKGIKAPLNEWADMGHITFVDDVEIPPKLVVEWFNDKMKLYNIKRIAIDNFRYSLMNFCFKEIGFEAFEKKNIKLVRPSDIMKASPIINSVFVNQNLSWGNSPIMNWYTNNTKKVLSNGNISYAKIEEHYRKTDGFMSMVNAFIISEDIENEYKETVFMPPLIF